MRKVLVLAALLVMIALPVHADIAFVNGGFEDGDLTGWTFGAANPGTLGPLSGAGVTSYNGGLGGIVAAVMSPGQDPIVPIQQTYNGSNSARVGDSQYWGGYPYQYNKIGQSAQVTGIDPGHLYFAWAAVLEISGHSYADTPFFEVKVRNDTQGIDIYDVVRYEQDGGFWTNAGNGWEYSTGNNGSYPGWYVEDLDLAALNVALGDTLTLTATARDCNPTGHAMYVYLDGFGGTPPPPPGGEIPEPATMFLLGSGLVGLAGYARKRMKK